MGAYLLYLLGSLAGVALMVGICVALFGMRETRLTEGAATERLLADDPGFKAGRAVLSADAKSALVENAANGTVHLVVAVGDRLVARELSRAVLRDVVRESGALSLRLSDFTLPKVRLTLGDEALFWDTRLAGAPR
jgi:hypothetical protein